MLRYFGRHSVPHHAQRSTPVLQQRWCFCIDMPTRAVGKAEAVVISAVTLALWILPLGLYKYYDDWHDYVRGCSVASMGTFLVPFLVVFKARACTEHMLDATTYVFWVWMAHITNSASFFLTAAEKSANTSTAFRALNFICQIYALRCLYRMQNKLVRTLESNFLAPIGERRLHMVFQLFLLVSVPFIILTILWEVEPLPDHRLAKVVGVMTCLWISLEAAQVFCAQWSFTILLPLVKRAAETADEGDRERLRSARRTLKFEAIRLGSSLSLVILSHLVYGISMGRMWPIPPEIREKMHPETIDTIRILFVAAMNTLSALSTMIFSGGLSGALAQGISLELKEQARLEKRVHSTASFTPCSDPDWQAKVEDLGSRGIKLSALLRFYKGLGHEYMYNFDSRQHTTSDVVRFAIIPMSALSSSCCASVLMAGEQIKPSKMVTHNWNNHFHDLVAAVVADALKESTYGNVANLLRDDVHKLESWCSEAGANDCTYWICAFAVNQHVGICASNPYGGKDSVSGEDFPLCSCAKLKYFNDSPPCRYDGESIECEMNKFDDMMKWLATTDKDFGQVIAVDRKFDLFTRAWCVAELAAAYETGMKQQLKVISGNALRHQEGRLRSLKVQDMQAARKEDADMILSKIPDHEVFNQQLQSLLFGTLMLDWWKLDETQKLAYASHAARWQAVTNDSKSPKRLYGSTATFCC